MSSLRDQMPANTTYVAGSTRLNGATVADNGGLSPLVERHCDPLAGGSDARPTARRCSGGDEQRRHDHVRRASSIPLRARRHRDLEPGVREAAPAASSTTRPTIRTRRSRTIRRATSSAACRCCSPTSVRRCRSTTARRASSIRAMYLRYTITIYNTGSSPRRTSSLTRPGAGEHDLRRELHDAERCAVRAARWRRLAADRRHQRGHAARRTPPQSCSSTCA